MLPCVRPHGTGRVTEPVAQKSPAEQLISWIGDYDDGTPIFPNCILHDSVRDIFWAMPQEFDPYTLMRFERVDGEFTVDKVSRISFGCLQPMTFVLDEHGYVIVVYFYESEETCDGPFSPAMAIAPDGLAIARYCAPMAIYDLSFAPRSKRLHLKFENAYEDHPLVASHDITSSMWQPLAAYCWSVATQRYAGSANRDAVRTIAALRTLEPATTQGLGLLPNELLFIVFEFLCVVAVSE